MLAVLCITILTCITLISVVLLKPSVEIKRHSISIYWCVVVIGAMTLIFGGFLSTKEVLSGLTADTSINPLKILVLFISMTIQSIFLDEIGFFRFLANVALKKAKSSQKTLFLYLYIMVSVLTIFTSNDIIILTFTPFICYFAKNAKINPIPYLFAEFVAANTWSMCLEIGNPTNIYLSTANGITFLAYAKVMLLPTMCGGITALLVLFLIFHKSLSQPITPCVENVRITDKAMLGIGVTHISLCTILLVISSYIGLDMWFITMCFAISLFLCVLLYQLIAHKKSDALLNCLKRAPWELIPFVISMFIMVQALDKYGITQKIGSLLGTSDIIMKYGVMSFLTANLINNIPMSVLFSSVVHSVSDANVMKETYAAIVGSNIGAFFTPIGALAGIMWTGILKKHEVKFGFSTYIRYGVMISVPTLVATLCGLMIVL